MKITKLVRDKIPEKFSGWTKEKITKKQLIDFILKKVNEEASEVCMAKTKNERTEEIADLYEIVSKLMEVEKISINEVKKIAKIKNQKNGQFKKNIVLTFEK